MEDQHVYLYVTGTAGSGKSTFCRGFGDWFATNGQAVSIVNLDPGVEYLPYQPDFDIREHISIVDVMEEYNLGPNGAQIAAADLMALNFNDFREDIVNLDTDYVIIDTPGQIELFAFRSASRKIVESLNEKRSAIAYVIDPTMCTRPRDFISQAMLAATVHVRFPIPLLNILSKIDMITDEDRDRILKWSVDDEALYTSLEIEEEHGADIGLNWGLFRVLEELGIYRALTPVSSVELFGMDEVYNILQNIFFAGEDLPSELRESLLDSND